MEDQDNSLKRIVAGGLFALFFACIVAALTVFGFFSMTLGHVFMVAAAGVGTLIIWTEIIPAKPAKHKIVFTVLLLLVLRVSDFAIVKHKEADLSASQPQTEAKPDIAIVLSNPKSFIIEFVNKSKVLIPSGKWWLGFIDLDRSEPTRAYTLPISGSPLDFIRPGEPIGDSAIFLDSRILPPLRDGERLVGFIGVSCPTCIKTRTYFVYSVYGSGGWYAELPMSQIDAIMKQPFANIIADPDAAFVAIPEASRIPVVARP
jgi:hypothetical protein